MVGGVLCSLCRLSSATGQTSRTGVRGDMSTLPILGYSPSPTPSLLLSFLLGGTILVASGGGARSGSLPCLAGGRVRHPTPQQVSCVIQCHVMDHLLF
ncbi:hypothetical protein CGRA01v4_03431 [Colletotrichum graminicola]|nr:hypothetical protein CGRA01v4_03431 [Colletotrichum graminicola]